MPPRTPLSQVYQTLTTASSSRFPQPRMVIPLSRSFHTTFAPLAISPANRPPQDHAIPYTMVQLVSPTNQLLPPQLLTSLLKSTDLTTNTIILSSSDPPIVRIHDRQTFETRLRDTALKNSLRDKTKFEEKEIQISWTSASGDIEHRIELAKNILAKGDRVTILFAIKGSPRRDRMTPEEKKEMIRGFEEGLEEVGRKWQDDLVKGKAVALHYEPKEEVREEFVAKFKEKILEEKKEKGDKKEARRKKDEERRLASSKKD